MVGCAWLTGKGSDNNADRSSRWDEDGNVRAADLELVLDVSESAGGQYGRRRREGSLETLLEVS